MKMHLWKSIFAGIAMNLAVSIGEAGTRDVMEAAPETHRVLLENEQVRVLEYASKPGQKSARHSHPDHILYVIDSGKLKFFLDDGRTTEVELKAGTAIFKAAETHRLENTGMTAVKGLAIELKAAKGKDRRNAADLEMRLKTRPQDLDTRLELMAEYAASEPRRSDLAAVHARYIFEHQASDPRAPEAATTLIGLDGETARSLSEILAGEVAKAKRPPLGLLLTAEAYSQFLDVDDTRRETFLRRAAELYPDVPKVSQRLGELYLMRAQNASLSDGPDSAKSAAEYYRKFLTINKDPLERFYALGDAGEAYLAAGEKESARSAATELLNMAPQYSKNWHYGNALHQGHILLGWLAMKKDDAAGARRELIEAGRTTGSPQLDSFGPDHGLADALLEKGDKETVLEYLKLCGNFWKEPKREKWLKNARVGRKLNS